MNQIYELAVLVANVGEDVPVVIRFEGKDVEARLHPLQALVAASTLVEQARRSLFGDPHKPGRSLSSSEGMIDTGLGAAAFAVRSLAADIPTCLGRNK